MRCAVGNFVGWGLNGISKKFNGPHLFGNPDGGPGGDVVRISDPKVWPASYGSSRHFCTNTLSATFFALDKNILPRVC
jgi:hypothetical protein